MDRRFAVLSALLAFSVVSLHAASISAQSPCERPDKIDHGREWASWSSHLREIYLLGFIEGQSDTFVAMFNDIPANRRDPLRQQVFTFHGTDSISRVMTDLYRDPANTFIRYGSMVYIGRDKLSGRDIEPMLRRSRQMDCSFPGK